jgi:hypothetical protein
MNLRSHCFLPALVVLSICICSAYGQAIDPVPSEAKTAADAAPYRGEIERFVGAQVELLKDSSRPARQSAARDALINELNLPGQQDPQPSFLDVYADALNRALTAEVAGHQDVRVRLLGAIVAARVAERADNARLVPVVERYLTDGNWTVSLWAMKAARPLVRPVLRNPLMVQQNRLIGAIVQGATNHPQGPVVQEAYVALVTDLLDPARRVEGLVVRQVVSAVQALFEMRIGQFRQGIPENLLAENRATLFLTEGRIWQAQNADERARTAGLIADHILLAGEHIGAGRGARDQLVQVLQQSAGATVVMARAMGDTAMEDAANALRQIRPVTPPDQIALLAQACHDAIRAAFPDRQQPVADAPPQ